MGAIYKGLWLALPLGATLPLAIFKEEYAKHKTQKVFDETMMT